MNNDAQTELLNDAQQLAVTASPGQHLILAGAGSGKTRVLVNRIACLMQEQHLSPYNILAVTFTNKAAKEMLGRVEKLVGINAKSMWVGTFHGLAHRLLRQHWQAAELNENFQIIDSEDQYRIIRRIVKSLNLDEKQWPPKRIQWFINQQKDEGLRAQHVEVGRDFEKQTMLNVYREYETICQESDLVDFAELLLRNHELLTNNPDILQHYQQRFQYVLVDEFQDTNAIQYAWLRLFIGNQGNFMAVGDDDQSIYAWRGAKIENIHTICQDYPDTEIIRLEQNYRSTATILSAANALIAKNSNRMGKNLWTDGDDGEPILLYSAFNDLEEARFVVNQIQSWTSSGHSRRDCAILYRSNAQSRLFEEALLHEGIPYRIHGGLRFFERAEIKDALAYLRLLLNPHDSAAFERVVNTPARGIGEQTMSKIRLHAREHQQSLWLSVQQLLTNNALSKRAHGALCHFMDLIEGLAENTKKYRLDALTEETLNQTGLLNHYRNSKLERSQTKVENLEELITATQQFHSEYDNENILREFLAHASLEAGEAQADAYEDCVQLMTLHAAKGLEFPLVFICGLEEGLFPHARCASNPAQLEEERRLFYVGMTRAMERLFLSHCELRRLHGKEQRARPSRFLKDIPKTFINKVRPSYQTHHYRFEQPIEPEPSYSDESAVEYSLGQRVIHKSFGEGTIIDYDIRNGDSRIRVEFDDSEVGSKWLVASIAKLEPA